MRVKVKVVDEFVTMLTAPKTLLRFGGVATKTVAVEVFPVPPLVEVTWTELL
jgi:hypothetical protein